MAVEIFKEARRQDDLVHGWARTLVATQGAEALAVGALWFHLANEPGIRTLTILVVAIVGITTCWVCISIAISDLRWQGKYVEYVTKLDPTGVLFPDYKPNSKNMGVQATWLHRLRLVLTGVWCLVAFGVVGLYCRG